MPVTTSPEAKFLCHCMQISKKTIDDCINSGCASLAEVVECTKAGSCCTACHKKIIKIIDEKVSK